MIPGMVGKNIGEWIKNKDLPKTVSKFGTHDGRDLRLLRGAARRSTARSSTSMPTGAMGIYTFGQKFKPGLQQLMAGSRNFNLSTMTRKDLMALTGECEEVTGIPYVMDAYRKEAEKWLK